MAQISVSLDVISEVKRMETLPGSTTLEQLLPEYRSRVPSLEDAIFVAHYRIDEPESALYELGVRTGDLFALVLNDTPLSRTESSSDGVNLSLGLNVLRPSVDVLEVSDYATVGDVQAYVKSAFGAGNARSAVYVGRYAPDLQASLDTLGLTSGDMLSLALLPTQVDYALLLVPARGGYSPFRVSDSSAIMGGGQSSAAIDITQILPRRKRHLVQGPQAEFSKINDVWHVQALPTANAPLFVDSQRLFPQRPKALFENNVISLGSSPTEPLLQLVVQFDVE